MTEESATGGAPGSGASPESTANAAAGSNGGPAGTASAHTDTLNGGAQLNYGNINNNYSLGVSPDTLGKIFGQGEGGTFDFGRDAARQTATLDKDLKQISRPASPRKPRPSGRAASRTRSLSASPAPRPSSRSAAGTSPR